MKKKSRICYSVPLLAALVLFCLGTSSFAQEDKRIDRLERLEQRVNEIAQRQEQMMERLDAALPQQDPHTPSCDPGFRPQANPMMAPAPACSQPVCPHAVKHARCCRPLIGVVILGVAVINILLAIWIYTDIRKRNEGSGIFIVLALLAGIPTAIIYALVRIGDRKP
jgi:hypothetical protein